ncbi:uncharacterized protein HD556DRAFT_1497516 [Suillus plorans]|uniref:DUF6533 domain-containing protein n=1 Tax=Suillus plorans TaxID=116603 RepID=A0A9P7DRQ1_9AGAM|nr:uncharacterized protein HD556DRAFT_1497516 [Suillus plorans]KAG1801340.1 hypothetical protein HD556DRAFT_1497516 [Suillus plorans]
MPLVSDDPSWWPIINASIVSSYFIVAASVGVGYDWALTLAQEIELIWRQRWSLMTALYLCLRYVGLVYAPQHTGSSPDNLVDRHSENFAPMPAISVYSAAPSCRGYIYFVTLSWITFVSTAMLGVIMIVRLYAMYQQSRKVLIPLVVTFLALSIINVTTSGKATKNSSAMVLILSGSYVCSPSFNGNGVLLVDLTWIIGIAWEVFVLSLAIWIAVIHIRELSRSSARGILGDCFTVLIKTHVVYFTGFVAVSCFQIGYLSPVLSTNPFSLETQIYLGFSQILTLVQMVVLGPRLILGVREFNARLVADSDAGMVMTSIAFQERVHITTGSGV